MNNTTISEYVKVCTKCQIEKPLTNEYFAVSKKHSTGFKSQCKDCSNKYRNENKTRFNNYAKEYHAANNQVISKRKKGYYEKNKESLRVKALIYRNENILRIKEYKKKYKKENGEYFRMKKQERRALELKLPRTLTINEWEEIKTAFNNSCAYCGELKELQQDHFIALSRGGGYTQENILPACISCNSSKNDKEFFEWYPSHKNFSYQRKEKIIQHLSIL